MSTTFTSNETNMGTRSCRQGGAHMQCEFSAAQWADMDMDHAVDGDDGSHWNTRTEWMAEMQNAHAFSWMNRFAMNRCAQEAAATAHRWSSTGHHTVAHAAAAMAQAARNWRG